MDIKFESADIDGLNGLNGLNDGLEMPFLDLYEPTKRTCANCKTEVTDYIEHNQHFGRFINSIVTCSLDCMRPYIRTCSFCHKICHDDCHLFEMQNSISKVRFVMSFCSSWCRKEFFGHRYDDSSYKFKNGYTFKVSELLCKRLMIYGLKSCSYKI